MSSKTNDIIKEISLRSGDKLGGSACRTCRKSYCCEFMVEIGIATSEFNEIAHLVTPQQIARAKHEIDRLAKQEVKWRKEYEELYKL